MDEQTGTVSTASNGIAIASFVIGVVSAFVILVGIWYGIIGGVIALITGLLGIQKAKRLGGHGLGLAITGTVIGGITVLLIAWMALR